MALSNATKLANFGSGIGTQGSVLEIDNANERIGLGTNNPQTMVQVGTGITMDGAKITATNIVAGSNITASTFTGDGSGLTNVGMDTSNVVSTATTTGLLNVTTSGTLDKLIVTNDSSVGGALTITGNFTVSGTQTIINTQSLEVRDKTVGIGSTASPSNTTADGAGIVVYGATEKSLKWNNTGTKWTLTGGALETAEVNTTGIITAARSNLTSLSVTGITTVTQGTDLNGYKVEEGSYDTAALNGEFDFEFENGHIQTHNGNTAGTYFPDFRVSSSQSLSSVMDVGDVVSATLIVKASNTAHYCTTGIKIDNSTSNLTIEWIGSAAPAAGKGAGFDLYSFTIQKTAATPAYLIIVNATDAG